MDKRSLLALLATGAVGASILLLYRLELPERDPETGQRKAVLSISRIRFCLPAPEDKPDKAPAAARRALRQLAALLPDDRVWDRSRATLLERDHQARRWVSKLLPEGLALLPGPSQMHPRQGDPSAGLHYQLNTRWQGLELADGEAYHWRTSHPAWQSRIEGKIRLPSALTFSAPTPLDVLGPGQSLRYAWKTGKHSPRTLALELAVLTPKALFALLADRELPRASITHQIANEGRYLLSAKQLTQLRGSSKAPVTVLVAMFIARQSKPQQSMSATRTDVVLTVLLQNKSK